MSNGYLGNMSYKQHKYCKEKGELLRGCIREKICEEFKVKQQPKLGPRSKLCHYIFDLNLSNAEAIKEIIKEFPAIDEKIINEWIKEEREKREKGKENNKYER